MSTVDNGAIHLSTISVTLRSNMLSKKMKTILGNVVICWFSYNFRLADVVALYIHNNITRCFQLYNFLSVRKNFFLNSSRVSFVIYVLS